MRDVPIDGVSLEVAPEYLWLRSARPLRVLSSGVVGDDLTHAQHVLSVRVPLQYDSRAPESELLARAADLGISQPFVGMLTAVDLSKAVVQVAEGGDLRVLAVVTVGVGNATAAGSVAPGGTVAGTINVVLVVDAEMTQGALVNAVITATEAKTLALLAADLRTRDGEPASGTSSDAIVVACTGWGRKLRYAGAATTVGLLIGRLVRRAVGKGLAERDGGNETGMVAPHPLPPLLRLCLRPTPALAGRKASPGVGHKRRRAGEGVDVGAHGADVAEDSGLPSVSEKRCRLIRGRNR